MAFYNSAEYFGRPLVDFHGFREYDARWIIRPIGEASDVELNYLGVRQVGNWLGNFLLARTDCRQIVVGHDFRDYSEHVKNALSIGLQTSGLDVVDVGLCTTPMAYFAQYSYDVSACAMVTASHNPVGWTGVKMGSGYSRTFGPDEMTDFKRFAQEQGTSLVMNPEPGHLILQSDLLDRYIGDLVDQWKPRLEGLPRLRVALETGNGTVGIVAPRLLRELGFDVVDGHTGLDWTFPNFNPNPEDMKYLRSVQELVEKNSADVGLCFDGDGDRLGVVADDGRIVFADRVALLIGRRLEQAVSPGRIVVDVKSTSLFESQMQSQIVWEKTGHSYLKAALPREDALAAFERSGHYFFAQPFGRGYDDGSLSALMLLWLLCEQRAENRRLSDLLDELPPSHQSPNRQPTVPEDRKYEIVDEVAEALEELVRTSGGLAGVPVREILKINGIRINLMDGSWLLVRASSNTPQLVILAETFDEDGAMLKELDGLVREIIRRIPDAGDFDSLYDAGR